MRKTIITLLIMLLLTGFAAATTEERITNGNFETGNLNGWTDASGGVYVIHNGFAPEGDYYVSLDTFGISSTLRQTIDLTDVDTINMYIQVFDTESGGAIAPIFIKIDGNTIFSSSTRDWAWLEKNFDVSGYDGQCTLSFEITQDSSVGLAVDDVSAIATISDEEEPDIMDVFNNIDSTKIDNFTNAFDGIDLDIENNALFSSFMTIDEDKSDYENTISILGAPLSYGVYLYGLWFYVFIIFVSAVTLYISTDSAGLTGLMLIIFSSVVITPAMTTSLVVPAPVINIMYGFAFLGMIGVVKSLIDEWW
jgi:hypothetical protein